MDRAGAATLTPQFDYWQCPTCRQLDRTPKRAEPTSRLHSCAALGGLSVPMVQLEAGQTELARGAARHQVVERVDYLNSSKGQPLQDGRPVMAVRTERGDGSHDTTVFAPVLTATGVN